MLTVASPDVTSFPAGVVPLPEEIPAACFNNQPVGGVFTTKEKDLSGFTVITTGVGVELSRCAVLALNSLQKSMDFTPRAPSAGPTGGEGVALPAGTVNLRRERKRASVTKSQNARQKRSRS